MHVNQPYDNPHGVRLSKVLGGHTNRITNVAYHPKGRSLASCAADHTVKVWNLDDGSSITLRGHLNWVRGVAYNPQGTRIASGSDDCSVRIWDSHSGELLQTLTGHPNRVFQVAYDPLGKILASASDDRTVKLWDAVSGESIGLLKDTEWIYCTTFSTDGTVIASGNHKGCVKIWDVSAQQELRTLESHKERVYGVAFSPLGEILASCSYDGTIKLWNYRSGKLLRTLEAHDGPVQSIAFDCEGRLLCSRGRDGKNIIWRTDTWSKVATINEPTTLEEWISGIAFNPSISELATGGPASNSRPEDRGKNVNLWRFDYDQLTSSRAERHDHTVHYLNAKVLLLGDSGVGKSALAQVLSGMPYQSTDSSAGQSVQLIQSEEIERGDGVREYREIFIWDFAGQPGYRIVHQLSLAGASVGLLVMDTKDEISPLAGVQYWARALRTANKLERPRINSKLFLVSARNDRGGLSVSDERIDKLIREFEIERHFRTSAKEGWEINELREAIKASIPWETLPIVTSTALLGQIKAFIVSKAGAGEVLSPVNSLLEQFAAVNPEIARTQPELHQQFITCIGRLENRGLVRQMTFGGYVLLQPEFLQNYVSALVNHARDEPDGRGSILEKEALSLNFFVPPEHRFQDESLEQLLVHAAIVELVAHDLAFRESSNEAVYLVLPSQVRRDFKEAPKPLGTAVSIEFDGPVQNIYVTLAVRLGHSGVFKNDRSNLWRNASRYIAKFGGICGIYLCDVVDEGHGCILLFYEGNPTMETQFHFEDFVFAHVSAKALPESVRRSRHFACPNCNNPVPEGYVTLLRERGRQVFDCPCGTEVWISEPHPLQCYGSQVEALNNEADILQNSEKFLTSARGETATPEFLDWAGNHKPTLAIVLLEIASRNVTGDSEDDVIRANQHARDFVLVHGGRKVLEMGARLMAAFYSANDAFDFIRDFREKIASFQLNVRIALHVGPLDLKEQLPGNTVETLSRMIEFSFHSQIVLSDNAVSDVKALKEDIGEKFDWGELKKVDVGSVNGLPILWII